MFAKGIDGGRVLCVRKDAEQAGRHVEKVIERAQLPRRGAEDRCAVRNQQAPSPVSAPDGPGAHLEPFQVGVVRGVVPGIC